MPEATFFVSVKVRIDETWANVNEILHAVSEARDAFGVKLTQHVIEWMQEDVRDRLCAPDRRVKKGLGSHPMKDDPSRQCACRSCTKAGHRDDPRLLKTDVGTVGFRVGVVMCRRCGKRFAPILDVLRLRRWQRHGDELERLVTESANQTAFARSVANVEGLTGVPVSKSSSHRWVTDLKLPESKPPSVQQMMADGTRYKRADGRRGELRVAIGFTTDKQIIPLGAWSGAGWKEIGRDLRRRLASKPSLLVADGEPGLSRHLARLTQREQRSHFQFFRDLRYSFWADGQGKSQWKPIQPAVQKIVGIEIPDGEWESILPLEKAALRERVESARREFQGMIDSFGAKGYNHAAEYLRNAKDRLFSRIDLWLETGIVAPKSTGILEEIIREIGRRVKKLGWNWGDHGITQQAKMILLRRYDEEAWTDHWTRRLQLQGRCQISLEQFHRVA